MKSIPLISAVLVAASLTGCSKQRMPACQAEFALEALQIQSESQKPSPRFDQAMATDPGKKRIFLFGGRNGSRLLDDLWVLEPDAGRWTKMETGPGPIGRGGASLVYDRSADRLILFGGFSYDRQGQTRYLRDLWTFTRDGGWSREFFEVGPQGRAWQAAVIYKQELVIYGGYSGKPHFHLNDCWALRLEDLTFRRLASDRGPRMAGRPALLPDPQSGKILIFGRDGIPRPERTGLWTLEPSADRWSAGDAVDSLDADFTQAVPDEEEQTIVVLKGPGEDERSWKIWLFQGAENRWCRKRLDRGADTPQGMVCSADPTRNRAWICFGGARRSQLGDQTLRLVQLP